MLFLGNLSGSCYVSNTVVWALTKKTSTKKAEFLMFWVTMPEWSASFWEEILGGFMRPSPWTPSKLCKFKVKKFKVVYLRTKACNNFSEAMYHHPLLLWGPIQNIKQLSSSTPLTAYYPLQERQSFLWAPWLCISNSSPLEIWGWHEKVFLRIQMQCLWKGPRLGMSSRRVKPLGNL